MGGELAGNLYNDTLSLEFNALIGEESENDLSQIGPFKDLVGLHLSPRFKFPEPVPSS